MILFKFRKLFFFAAVGVFSLFSVMDSAIDDRNRRNPLCSKTNFHKTVRVILAKFE